MSEYELVCRDREVRLETRHIHFIETIVRKGSISAAADEIGLTQPALTKIIARLEDELGAALFDRRPRGVVPTAFGRRFLERLAPVTLSLETLAREVRAMRAGLAGTVAVGIGQFWVARIFPSVVAELAREVPEIQVKVVTGAREDLVAGLRSGELDIVLASLTDEPMPDLHARPLLDIELFLTVRADHPLTRLGRPVSPDDLGDARWVLAPPNDPSVIHLNNVFLALGHPPPVVAVEAVSHQFVVGMLRGTDLISALPDIGRNVFRQGLAKLDAEWLAWTRRAGVFVSRERALLPAGARLIETLEHHVREVGGLGAA